MKNKTFISLIALLLLASISFIGCNDDGGGGSSQGTQALTENDFANDPSLRADPEKGVIVDFLEPPDADIPQNDTGDVGNDTIPLRYTRTVEDTFCWEDDNSEAMDYMVLSDGEGNEVLRVDVNGDCVTDTIEAGDYVMTLYHDESMGDTLPVFIIPNPDNNQQARETDGLFNGFKVVIAKILKGIENIISKDARAQTVEQNIATLLRTNSCVGCNLERANLEGADLSGADLSNAILINTKLSNADLAAADLNNAIMIGTKLSNADLSNAMMMGADLFGADLSNAMMMGAVLTDAELRSANLMGAVLTDADLVRADLFGADLSNAMMMGAVLTDADLTRANLMGAVLTDADLVRADLTNVNLIGAFLQGATFDFAIWCDGRCTCGSDSIGLCRGCNTVDRVCTGS
jgi:uncharacterized protein YjbI with pentapeptide repeats/predicted small secreted protein